MQGGGSNTVSISEIKKSISPMITTTSSHKRSHDQISSHHEEPSDKLRVLSKKIKITCDTIDGFQSMLTGEDDYIKFHSSTISSYTEILREEVKILEFHKLYRDAIINSTKKKYVALLQLENQLKISADMKDNNNSEYLILLSKLHEIKTKMSSLYPNVTQSYDGESTLILPHNNSAINAIHQYNQNELLQSNVNNLYSDGEDDDFSKINNVSSYTTNNTTTTNNDNEHAIEYHAINSFDGFSDNDDFSLPDFPLPMDPCNTVK
jgi:hypothetical protein